MKPLKFDVHGYLTPYEPIEADVETLEHHFVTKMIGRGRRRALFKNYLNYTERFQKEVFPYFEQWINGSFVTLAENPNDLDIVTFLDFEIFEMRNPGLDGFLSFALEEEGIDAYIVPVYPAGHEHTRKTVHFRNQWLKRFSLTKSDENDVIHPKGFLQLKFE